MTRHHNAVLDRIVKALRPPEGSEVRVNQTVPGFQGNLRPDLVILEPTAKRITIIDVTIPFENRYAAFEAARREKQLKYQNIVEYFKQRGFETSLDAFVVGSLGVGIPQMKSLFNALELDRATPGFCESLCALIPSDRAAISILSTSQGTDSIQKAKKRCFSYVNVSFL